ncbi:uncharacterized protein [Pyxicephalus adspersus]|uniref:uncharacterized protein n=1 Tax=Pyxicephalus adspersus TaxID=30357 RepID=UPI003B5B9563
MRMYRSVELRHVCSLENMETCIQPTKNAAEQSTNQAIQAAVIAAKHQKQRPKSLCSVGNGIAGSKANSGPSSLGGLLDLLKQRSGRKSESAGGSPAQDRPPCNGSPRPLSMSVLDINRISGSQTATYSRREFSRSSGFLRGSSTFSSQRWNVFGSKTPEQKKNFSSLRKSFSFRLRRSAESRKEGDATDRLRSRSEDDSYSLHTVPSRRDLLVTETPAPNNKESRQSFWQLLTSPFRKKEYATSEGQHRSDGGRTEPVLVAVSCTENRGLGGKSANLIDGSYMSVEGVVPNVLYK